VRIYDICVAGQNGDGYFRHSTNPESSSWTLEDRGSAAMKSVFCLTTAFCAIDGGKGAVHIATSRLRASHLVGRKPMSTSMAFALIIPWPIMLVVVSLPPRCKDDADSADTS
jgi:hypothetical protein